MVFYVLVIVALALGCIVFGLLRAESGKEGAEENPVCEACEEDESSCGHFCFRRPATRVRDLLTLRED